MFLLCLGVFLSSLGVFFSCGVGKGYLGYPLLPAKENLVGRNFRRRVEWSGVSSSEFVTTLPFTQEAVPNPVYLARTVETRRRTIASSSRTQRVHFAAVFSLFFIPARHPLYYYLLLHGSHPCLEQRTQRGGAYEIWAAS